MGDDELAALKRRHKRLVLDAHTGGPRDDAALAEIYELQVQIHAAQREAALAEAAVEEAPLLADLRALGIEARTVWDLYRYPDAYPAVVPVLLRHLARDYPDCTLWGIGASLAHKSARPWWEQIKAMYLSDSREPVRDRLAAALADIAIRKHYQDLLAFLADPSLGASRGHFVRPIHRIGNRMSPGAGRAAIEPYVDDAEVGIEVAAVLAGRSANR